MCMKKSAAAQEIASWRKMSASYEEARPQSVSCWCRVSFLAWRHHENLALWLPLSSHSSLGCPLFWHQPFPIRRKDSPRFWTVFLLLGPEKERMSVFPKQESFCGILQPSVTIHFTSQDFFSVPSVLLPLLPCALRMFQRSMWALSFCIILICFSLGVKMMGVKHSDL